MFRFLCIFAVLYTVTAVPVAFPVPTWKPWTEPTVIPPEVNPITSDNVCAVLYHETNFAGNTITIEKGHDAAFATEDQGKMRSVVLAPGCTLETYTRTAQGHHTCNTVLGAGVSRFGYFNTQFSCQNVKCFCGNPNARVAGF